jgi:hypothetical protein
LYAEGPSYAEFRVLVRTNIRNQTWGFFDASESSGVVVVTDGPTNNLFYGMFYSGGYHTTVSSGSAHNSSNTPYWIALRLTDGETFFKEWLASTSEPSSWQGPTSTSSTLVPASIAKFRYSNGQVSGAGTFGISYISTSFPSTQCTDGSLPAEGGGAVPSGTHLLNDVLTPLDVPSGGSYPVNSVWQTTNSILTGTALVSVNGILQSGSAWTLSDADYGFIEMHAALTESATVTMAYITNGAIP